MAVTISLLKKYKEGNFMVFKYLLTNLFTFLLLIPSAFASSYTDTFYRQMTKDEITWAGNQSVIKQFNCTEYLISKELKTVNGFSVVSTEPTFSQRPLFANAKVSCSISNYNSERKELTLSVDESGLINDNEYRVSHTGFNVIGGIKKGWDSWDLTCEHFSPKKDSDKTIKRCFIERSTFFIQKTPKINEIPEGYIISVNKNIFKPIEKLTIDNKVFSNQSEYPFIFGKDASDAIEAMKVASDVTYSYTNPMSGSQNSDKIEPTTLELLQPAIKLLDQAYQLYKN